MGKVIKGPWPDRSDYVSDGSEKTRPIIRSLRDAGPHTIHIVDEGGEVAGVWEIRESTHGRAKRYLHLVGGGLSNGFDDDSDEDHDDYGDEHDGWKTGKD